ncbi:RTA1-domain-containing protein [Aspergillus campestris IBT 28561]|uniref:RTA1-domain-containing protein n=1 Tax=Aspergillus campestris (strain IBT 28561) TaxID=1392248 RepID=A0A2I1D6F4_ASPC2|nr:RTA1-domain-containing protein [Aspergillus campestris IBT 28561]PKY05462.1 RTA1-domain-containing protein [Aspergillus campestris IBT 28561]
MYDLPTNHTLLDHPELCTLETCPLDLAWVQYLPSFSGNSLYLGVFGVAFFLQFVLGAFYKTWSFMIPMVGGCLLEILGYMGRVRMHHNPFRSDTFFLVCLTIGPAFISAAIYLCLSRIVIAFGERIAAFKPRVYSLTFIAADIIAIILQAVGSALACVADDKDTRDISTYVMIAGLACQALSLAVFVVLCIDFTLRVQRAPIVRFNAQFDPLRRSPSFRLFLAALAIATVAVFVRSVFRCVELSQGFDGKLAGNEITYMVLEGAMVALAVVVLTFFHPGWVWNEYWAKAAWHVRSSSSYFSPSASSKSKSTRRDVEAAYKAVHGSDEELIATESPSAAHMSRLTSADTNYRSPSERFYQPQGPEPAQQQLLSSSR